jgi:thioredoxin 1
MYKTYSDLPSSSTPDYDGPKAPQVKTIADKKKIIQSNQIAIFKCGAAWCQPCRMIAPRVDELATRLNTPGKIMIVSEDFDDKLSAHVDSVPIFDYYFEGRKIHRQHGADMEELEKNIERMLIPHK